MKTNDFKELEWAYTTFQKCIPVEYRNNISVLIGKYVQEQTINNSWEFFKELINETDGIELYCTKDQFRKAMEE